MENIKQEMFDEVDENNTPTGKKITRADAHQTGKWHRTVHVYLFRLKEEIELLVHLRSKTKDLCPNRWDTRFGGHLKAGETVEECVKNELDEEIGLKLDNKKLTAGKIYKRPGENNSEFSYQFYYQFEDDENSLKFNDGEVQAVRWLSLSKIKSEMLEKPETWASKRDFSEIEKDLTSVIS